MVPDDQGESLKAEQPQGAIANQLAEPLREQADRERFSAATKLSRLLKEAPEPPNQAPGLVPEAQKHPVGRAIAQGVSGQV